MRNPNPNDNSMKLIVRVSYFPAIRLLNVEKSALKNALISPRIIPVEAVTSEL